MEQQPKREVSPPSITPPARTARQSLAVRLRATAASQKAGPCTPSPSWTLADGGGGEERVSVAVPAPVAPARRSSVSARQLGATLWEIQGTQAHPSEQRRGRRRRAASGEEEMPKSSDGVNKHIDASLIQQHNLQKESSHALRHLSPASYSSSITEWRMSRTADQTISPSRSDIKIGSRYTLRTSTELLKVLNRIWSLEEQQAANDSLVRRLKRELQQAQDCAQELSKERLSHCTSVSGKEHKQAQKAIQSMHKELEEERRLRKRSESLHNKASKEISEARKALLKTAEDTESEREARHVLERLCDEFAKGIRAYEEEFCVLKRRCGGDCDERVDRLVVRMSEAWLDERMQMQLADSRGDSAGRDAVAERLNAEVQAFLKARVPSNGRNVLLRDSLESAPINRGISAPQFADDEADSSVSDLHCFELDMNGTASHGKSNRAVWRMNGDAATASSPERQFKMLWGHAESSAIKEARTGTDVGVATEPTKQTELDFSQLSSRLSEYFLARDTEKSRTSKSRGVHSSGPSAVERWAAARQNGSPEIVSAADCSPDRVLGTSENSLKAKLLQARFEGRLARLRNATVAAADDRGMK